MKKRIISMILSVLMIISMLPAAAVYAAGSTSVLVSADKTSVNPDDIVTFTVSIGAVEHLMGAQFDVKIPEGMTYIPNSAKLADNLRDTLKCVSADWTEQTMRFTMFGDGDYNNTGNTVILTFDCKINTDTPDGTITPEIIEIVLSDTNFEELEVQTNYDAAVVTVKQKVIEVTGVTVNPTELKLTKKEEQATLTASVLPANATNKNVTFTSNQPDVASVDSKTGVVTAGKNGTAVITVKTEDGGYTATCTVTVDIAHVHNMETVPAKESTCTVQGNNQYYHCKECGNYYKDPDGKMQTTVDAEKLALKPHTGGEATCTKRAVCTVCGQEYGDLAAHKFTKEVAEEKYLKTKGTCVDKAVYVKSCEVCGEAGTETFLGEKDPANHVGETRLENQKEATCQEPGYTGDKYCNSCDQLIEKGKETPLGDHNPASVWTTDGQSHWKKCQTVGCGNIFEKAPHSGGEATCTKPAVCEVCGVAYGNTNPENHKGETEIRGAKDATCTEDGYTGDTYCKDCDEMITKGETIPAGHKLEKVEATEATCIKEGNIEYYQCTNGCKKLFKDAEAKEEIGLDATVIPKDPANHTGETEIREAKEATCTEDGYTGDTYCKDCGQLITKGETVPAAGHQLKKVEAKAATQTEEGNIEYYQCPSCGKLFKDAEAKEEIQAEDTVIAKLPPEEKPSDEPEPENPSGDQTETQPGETDKETQPGGTTDNQKPETPDNNNQTTGNGTDNNGTAGTGNNGTAGTINNGTAGGAQPGTGDDSQMLLWSIVLAAAALGVAGVVLRFRKREDA